MATYKWGQAKNLPWYFDRKKFQHLSWVTLPDHRDESKITNNFVMGDIYNKLIYLKQLWELQYYSNHIPILSNILLLKLNYQIDLI